MAIIVILILGFLFRLINLNQSLWLDEAIQALTAQGSLRGVFTELRGDFHPPLYHLLSWFWVHLFGSSEIVLRLPSVFFGSATIYLVYLIAKLLVDSENDRRRKRLSLFPLIAASFLATGPFHLYYSQEARMYSLTTFLASLSMYFFLCLLKSQTSSRQKKRSYQLVNYTLATVLLLYSDYYGWLVLLAQLITAAAFFRKKMLFLLRGVLIVGFLFLPWLPFLFTQLRVGRQALHSLPAWGQLVNLGFFKALPLTLVKFSLGRMTIFNKKLYALVAGGVLLFEAEIIGRGLKEKFWGRQGRPATVSHGQLAALILWFIVPLLFAWLLSLFVPNYQPFRLLLALPAFYLLLAYCLLSFSMTTAAVIVVIILGINLFSVSVYNVNPYFHREDWRGVSRYIDSRGTKKAIALLPSNTSAWPYRYYSQQKVALITPAQGVRRVADEIPKSLKEKLADRDYVFYIRYLVPLFDPQEKISSWLAEEGFVKIKEISFNQIPIWEYERIQ